MLRLALIADDLTGALDASAGFAARGMRTIVATTPAGYDQAVSHEPEVLVVNTATREAAPETAGAIVAAIANRLAVLAPPIVFKKVDSRLKGPVAAEVAALKTLGFSGAVASPAIPAFGRLVRDGALYGSGVDMPIPVAAALGCAATVPDISSEAQLDAALHGFDGRQLLVGARGLAEALARRLRPITLPASPMISGPLLLGIGSRDPITLRQLVELAASGKVPITLAPDGEVMVGEPGTRLLHLVAADGADAACIGRRFGESLAREARSRAHGTLFACGGETALATLEALGVKTLTPLGEVFPGVPVSELDFDGTKMLLVTKSGGFGEPDLLVRLCAAVESR